MKKKKLDSAAVGKEKEKEKELARGNDIAQDGPDLFGGIKRWTSTEIEDEMVADLYPRH